MTVVIGGELTHILSTITLRLQCSSSHSSRPFKFGSYQEEDVPEYFGDCT